MNDLDKKLSVLSNIASVLNKNNIVWAIGGSMLLYFKNKTDEFNDIDIMVLEKDAQKLKELLLPLGKLEQPNPSQYYKTKYFFEFNIDNVNVDIMAGFIIVCNGKDYDCSLKPEEITEYTFVNSEKIPLHSLDNWRRFYKLMGRKKDF